MKRKIINELYNDWINNEVNIAIDTLNAEYIQGITSENIKKDSTSPKKNTNKDDSISNQSHKSSEEP